MNQSKWIVSKLRRATNKEYHGFCDYCDKPMKYRSNFLSLELDSPKYNFKYVCSYNCAELYILKNLGKK